MGLSSSIVLPSSFVRSAFEDKEVFRSGENCMNPVARDPVIKQFGNIFRNMRLDDSYEIASVLRIIWVLQL